MKHSVPRLVSMFSTKMAANKPMIVAILSVMVLSGCGKGISSYDFGEGELTLYQSGCLHRGTWTNQTDRIQREVRVTMQALDVDGNTLGDSKLTFFSTMPDETSDSREQRIDWKTGSFSGTDMNLSCRGISQVSAQAALVN